jgi:hypothetical protein
VAVVVKRVVPRKENAWQKLDHAKDLSWNKQSVATCITFVVK